MPDHGVPVPTATRGRLLAQQVRIGAVWVSLMEPEPGFDAAFNQWYGDDHFFAGGMAIPWIFAGRRWVTTRDLQHLRTATDDSPFQPQDHGRFLHLNLFSEHHEDDVAAALGDTIAGLAGEGRMYVDTIPRSHVFSRIQPYVGAVYRDPEEPGPLDIHALDHPFGGVVLEVVRAREGHDRTELLQWLIDEFLPAQLAETRASMCLIALDADLPDSLAARTRRIPASYDDAADRRVSLLWFTEHEPQEGWSDRFGPHPSAIADHGLGEVQLISPFIPLVPGTDRHIDRLR